MKRILFIVFVLMNAVVWADDFSPSLYEKVNVTLKEDINRFELGKPQQSVLMIDDYSYQGVSFKNCLLFADLDTNVNAERVYFKISKFSCNGKEYAASLVLMGSDSIAGLPYGKNYKTSVPPSVSPKNPVLIQNLGIPAGTKGYLIDFRPKQ